LLFYYFTYIIILVIIVFILFIHFHKDLRYSNSEGRTDESHLPGNNRPYGWLEVKVDDDSVINMTLPMIFTEQGYSNSLDVLLENVVVQSSVNFSHLLTAKHFKVSCYANMCYLYHYMLISVCL
jgi:hypothetical protein